MHIITTLNTAHNMSASAEGHNQPYFINSESLRRRAFISNCKWLLQSKTRICAIHLTFFWKTPHAERTPLTKVLFFTWKVFSAVWSLTPAVGCGTHAFVSVGEQRVHLTDRPTLLHQRFIFLSAGGSWMGKKNANNGVDAVSTMAIIWSVEREINCSK